MSFWSHQTLLANLAQIVPSGEQPKVDANSIELTLGSKVYISPSWHEKSPLKKTIQQYENDHCFTIPPGQFGFLQTTEIIKIPPTVMGFISLKSSKKMLGLVNVSGFHVDPGWEGHLTFAVFNAGPSPVHLKVGMELFLLWIADLDQETTKPRTKILSKDHFLATVNGVSGSVKSGYDLQAKLEQLDRKVEFHRYVFSILMIILLGITGRYLWSSMSTPDRHTSESSIVDKSSVNSSTYDETQIEGNPANKLTKPPSPDE